MGIPSFVVSALTEWDKLPQALRTQDSINGFRQQLKFLGKPTHPHSPSPPLTWTFF